ncbi:NAD-dependent epimerase/dehydratase family protein [Streptomyces lavenduligriseus]|uniref:NAD-dependent epimerase/dehydratase family protein n=1 Tax=Streptomyces lavenduligriseus TaxID=67315 RepID=A0ABT0NLK4_9ACTN|nr:NAD-dependent epimerase/dehydratase family protein [Streptomyces lavenduligriseus]MCL3992241.1 NAD-dependent epimerase/dehydratase family protein [Streptomyces lavenduligriseus]
MTTILITGASGFIGSRVTHWAARAHPDARLRLLRHHRAPAAAPAHATVVTGDVTDPDTLTRICADVDVLVHCSSCVAGPPDACAAVNAAGTRALVGEAARAGVRRIVYVSTAAVYGRGPFRDATVEELRRAPVSDASRSRAEAEDAVLAADGTVLRPHLVHGAGDRWVGPGITRLARALPFTVDGWRSLHSVITVDDLARLAVAAATAPSRTLRGRAYHANHPSPVSARTLLRHFARRAGLSLPHRNVSLEQARTHLRAHGHSTHDLDLLATDHWFHSTGIWRDTGCVPHPDPALSPDSPGRDVHYRCRQERQPHWQGT